MSFSVSLAALAALSAAFLALWSVQRRTRNAGIVDVAWAASIGALALLHGLFGDGWGPRRVLVTALAVAWSARLTLHLWRRVGRESEDGRYAEMRRSLGARFDRVMVWFFLAQALLAWLLALPMAQLANVELEGWRATDALAVALFAASIVGESIADRQLASWREDPANRGRTCRAGLWRVSRHPNYFFEWVHWLVYPVLAIGTPWGWLLWLAPLAMLLLVTKVTGIPPTEAQSLRSRGDDYRDYQRTTSAFFPWPPRTEAHATDRA
ncbi:MAG: DUF1295 domain-containing protein [Planctomycetota bacterium]